MWNATAEVIPVITGATETISKTVREQHTGKSRNQETTKSSRVGHCTYTSESTIIKA
jgi:hypothetical protein